MIVKASPLRLREVMASESRIGVAKSSYHQLSQFEIGRDNPCYQHLSENQCPVTAFTKHNAILAVSISK